jgi:hypothetical protein
MEEIYYYMHTTPMVDCPIAVEIERNMELDMVLGRASHK